MKIKEGKYEVDCTPAVQPDGRFIAQAVVTHLSDGHVDEIHPEFDPFTTAAEASSAAHTSALASIAQRGSES